MVKKAGPAQPMLEPSKPHHQEGRKLYQYIATFIVGLMTSQAGMALSWSSPVLLYLKSGKAFNTASEVQPLSNMTEVQGYLSENFPNLTETQVAWIRSFPSITEEQRSWIESFSVTTDEEESWMTSLPNITEKQASWIKSSPNITEEQRSWINSFLNSTEEQRAQLLSTLKEKESWIKSIRDITAEQRSCVETFLNITDAQGSWMRFFPNITEQQSSWMRTFPILTDERIKSSLNITKEQRSWIYSFLDATPEQRARMERFPNITQEQESWMKANPDITEDQRSCIESFLSIREVLGFFPNVTEHQASWMKSFLNETEKNEGITEEQGSWITSLLAIGAFVGAVPAGKIADKIGRKRALLSLNVPVLLSWVMIIFAGNLSTLYVARFIAGMAAGATCVLAPMYIGEIAEPSIRGALGASFALLFDFGILYSYVAGAFLSYTAFNLSCVIMALPFLAVFPFMPESPMWLVHQGRKVEANRALEVLRGPDYDTKAEVSILQEEADEHVNRKGGIRDLLGTRGGRKAIGTCIGLMVFQQLSGIDAMLAYAEEIFADADSFIDPRYSSIIIGIIHVIMAAVTALIIDRAGRRPLLTFSGTVTALCLTVLGFYFYLKNAGHDIHGTTWLPLATFAIYNISFAIGFGDIPWMIVSELFPPETKGVATSIAIMVNWALVFVVMKFFPIMQMNLGPANTYWIFGVFMVLGAAFAFFIVPETKGKTLQEIQAELNGEMPDIPLKTFATIS